jgi:cytoskeletal protein CcmA (bactofilin family)
LAGNNLTILAKGTYIRGDVYSEDMLVLEGGFEGNLTGDRVVIKNSAQVQGDLNCRSLSIESGGILNGEVRVISDLAALPDPSQVPDPEIQPGYNGSDQPPVIMDVEELTVDENQGKEEPAASVMPEDSNSKEPEVDMSSEEIELEKSAEKPEADKKTRGRLFGGSLFKK